MTGGIDISGDITVSSSAQSIVSSRAEADAYGISFEELALTPSQVASTIQEI